MTTGPEQLRASAREAHDTAGRARAVAAELAVRWRVLDDRVEPCLHAHRSDVWNSAAATASRQRLVRTVAREVGAARREMLRTSAALERHARRLEAQAHTDLARATELERLAWSAAQAAGGS